MSVLEQLSPLEDARERVSTVAPRRMRRRGWLVRRTLALADLTGLIGAFLVAELVAAPGPQTADRLNPQTEFELFALTLPLWIVAAKVYGLYDLDEKHADHSTADEFGRVFHLISIGTWLFFAFAWFTDVVNPYLPKLFVFWLLAIATVTAGRAVARSFCRRRPAFVQNTVVVGAGELGRLVAQKLLKQPELGLNVVGFVDDGSGQRGSPLPNVPLLGSPGRLRGLVTTLEVERVVIASPDASQPAALDVIRSLRGLDVQVNIVSPLVESLGPTAAIQMIDGFP